MTGLRAYALYLAWLTALAASLGSLYFSEVLGFAPCLLCWYQRAFMFPLAVILGIAAYRDDRGIAPYSLALAGIGGALSLYHYLLQKVPALGLPAGCTGGVSCSEPYIDLWGFVTIPFLALLAFSTVALLSCLVLTGEDRPDQDAGVDPRDQDPDGDGPDQDAGA